MFQNRSYKLELLDKDHIPKEDLATNLRELHFINTYLGGHAVTLKGLKSFKLEKNKKYTLADIGCGGGNTLLYLAKWAKRNGYHFDFVGIDKKADAIEFAKITTQKFPNINYVEKDFQVYFKEINWKPDFIVSALFCHHLNDAEFILYIHEVRKYMNTGLIINDLHRNPLAYYSIKFLTLLFSKSYLVKNDAPLSVLRGFSKSELRNLLEISKHKTRIRWAWAFRWCITENKRDL